MSKGQTKFVCRQCGYETPRWLGRCPECGTWGALEEVRVAGPEASSSPRAGRARKGMDDRERPSAVGLTAAASPAARGAVPITELPPEAGDRRSTGLGEVDVVLGGGLVSGSCLLLAGDPGVGKSTLLLSIAARLARSGTPVLYVTGEESTAQVRLRAQRIDALLPQLLVLAETDVLTAVEAARRSQAPVVIVDSIQTLYHPEISSPPGSVAQVRECAALMVDVAKGLPAVVWLVGHVTKDGAVAGPRMLEHMVDVVLQFEGDRSYPYRVLRGLKNRYGATDEIGIFELTDGGLTEVANPSQLFLGDAASSAGPGTPGTAVVAALEGRRVICAEVQALVVPSPWGAPRRTAMGLDLSRLALIVAVLERRAGLKLFDRDIYVKIAGGVRPTEPGADLAVAVAVASAQLDRVVRPGLVFAGELGLGGEVRQANRTEQRLREVLKLGFRGLVARGGPGAEGLEDVANIGQALLRGLERPRKKVQA